MTSSRREFDAYLTSLSSDQIALVRRLRVEEGCSYRAVAEACFEAWDAEAHRRVWFGDDRDGGAGPSNQGIGMEICHAAAKRLGEDWTQPPWH